MTKCWHRQKYQPNTKISIPEVHEQYEYHASMKTQIRDFSKKVTFTMAVISPHDDVISREKNDMSNCC